MSRRLAMVLTLSAATILVTGCPSAPTLVTVRIINNTAFDVDPQVQFGLSANDLETIDTGILAPGESAEVDLSCADALVLTATNSRQIGLVADFVLDPLPIFRLDTAYGCGDLIEFQFEGSGDTFDVFVDVEGVNLF